MTTACRLSHIGSCSKECEGTVTDSVGGATCILLLVGERSGSVRCSGSMCRQQTGTADVVRMVCSRIIYSVQIDVSQCTYGFWLWS